MNFTNLTRAIAVVTSLAALAATPAWAQQPVAKAKVGAAPSSLRAAPAADAMACTFRHPAVQRRAGCASTDGIDANHFLVQPPATASWTVVTPEVAYAAAPAPAVR